MDMVNIKINGMACEVPAGSTILEAAREAGIDIPTLCFLKDINQIGACRMCMVEVKGARSLVAACVYPVNEGMEVFTNTPKVQKSRKMTLELLLSVHDRKCLSCKRSGTCELQKLCNDMGIDDENRFEGAVPAGKKDYSTLHLERDNAKCILCRRCVAACQQQHVKQQRYRCISERHIDLSDSLQDAVGHGGKAVEYHADTADTQKPHSQINGIPLREQHLHDRIRQHT